MDIIRLEFFLIVTISARLASNPAGEPLPQKMICDKTTKTEQQSWKDHQWSIWGTPLNALKETCTQTHIEQVFSII